MTDGEECCPECGEKNLCGCRTVHPYFTINTALAALVNRMERVEKSLESLHRRLSEDETTPSR